MRFKIIGALALLQASFGVSAQHAQHGHAHNDYQHNIPFSQAYRLGFGSIEADVFLKKDTLFVSHDTTHFTTDLLLDVYLQALNKAVIKNHGFAYADTSKRLQLLIDLKTPASATLPAVANAIAKYPALMVSPTLKFVITGNQPSADSFWAYPNYLYFDGNLNNPTHVQNPEKIALFSADFSKFSHWNGKGLIPADERIKMEAAIRQAHALHKPFRFWGCPDNINTWYTFTKMGVDFINTDRIELYGQFEKNLPASTSISNTTYKLYQPTYKTDGDNTLVTNVILLIGDGTGLAEWYAGYTGNKGQLNVFNMRSLGLSKTSSADSYITDSGGGASAMATGEKTNNRYISVDTLARPIESLTEAVKRNGIRVGLITTGDVTDATPAAFYSHVKERGESDSIAAQLLGNNVDILIGDGKPHFNARKDGRNLLKELAADHFTVIKGIKDLDTVRNSKLLLLDTQASVHADKGRGDFLSKSLVFTMNTLRKNKAGFFIMAEGAQVDHGGHENQLDWLVQEVKDLDQAIGEAMRFADANAGTLVIVTADHETGGLSLLSGDIKSGYVSGQFSSDDHSGICVPVFAYGSQSRIFCGVYENTEIFKRIISLLGTKQTRSNKK